MKQIALLLFSVTMACSCGLSQKISKSEAVDGQVFYVRAYCGGARPTEAQLKGRRKPLPFAGKKLFIRKGDTNDLHQPVIDTVLSDDSGRFSLSLPPGDYCIVDQNRVDSGYYKKIVKEYGKPAKYTSAVDIKCLKEWLSRPVYIFKVIRGKPTHIRITFYQKCPWNNTPCVDYHGPMPP